ncbi:MAG: hypothetical protein HKL84_00200 [Acidimicrobiaceae bacterium]|nr:hypothetical protein [Acidimicrobiaceae bacterium]
MARNDPAQPGGFSIGEHPGSRSLFGLKRSQVFGEIASLASGFLVFLAVGSYVGLAVFGIVAILASLGFLVGFRRQTLDSIALGGASMITEKMYQNREQNRLDLFGFVGPPASHSYLVSSHKGGATRISEKRRRFPAGKLSQYRGTGAIKGDKVLLDDGFAIGVAREKHGKRGVAALEVFGESFIYKDPSLQSDTASMFGAMVGTLSSFANQVDSLVLLYLVDPEGGETQSTAVGAWSDELKNLYQSAQDNYVSRRCYILIRFSDVSFLEHDGGQLSSFISGLGLRYKALDLMALASIFAFGSDESNSARVIHVNSNWSHLLIGDRVMRLFEVAELPTGEVQPDFLVPFVSSLTNKSILSFELKVIDSRFALRKVRSRRSGITADAGVRALLGFLARNSETRAITSLERQENDLDLGYEMFSISGNFALFAKDLSEMKASVPTVTAKAEISGLVLECAYGRQLQVQRRLFGSSR